MPVLTREALRTQLKRREIAPVYVLFGPETYLRDIAVKTIADLAFSDGDFRDFNDTTFSLSSEDSLKNALAAAEQLPMMSTRRVIRITELRVSATGMKDSIKESHEAMLAAYLENPAKYTVIIFVADDLNGVRKMGKFLREKTAAVEFSRLDDRQLTELARTRISKLGAEADDSTLRYLISQTGSDVSRLTNEINKLCAAVLPSKTITAELIDSLVPNSRELSNFDLTDHLIAGRRSRAITVLKKILDDAAEPLALVGLISYNYRRLLMAKDLMERGSDRSEVAGAVKLRYNDQEPFIAAARRADMSGLDQALHRLASADLAIKTSKGGGGPTGARMQIEMLVCELSTLSTN